MRWAPALALVNAVFAVPSALIAEVEDLVVEGRDFIVSEDAFEAQRAHDRYSRFCEERLKPQPEGNRTSAAAITVLRQACLAESEAWDRREHLRDQEVYCLETALALIEAPAVTETTSLMQVAKRTGLLLRTRNRTEAEELHLCREDLEQVARLKQQLSKKVNQTAAAVAQVTGQMETGRGNVSAVKRQARSTVERIAAWDQSYGVQEERLAGEEGRKVAAARAMGEAVELISNFYSQRPEAGPLTQALDALDTDAPDLAALRDDDSFPANLLQVWPDAPDRPAKYVFHHALGARIVSVLQALSRVMQQDVDGTKHIEESVQAEARRVRGFRGRAAHETREHLARLKMDIKESDQALVVLKDRLHTEEGQLQAVLVKMDQLQILCAKVTSEAEAPDVARAHPAAHDHADSLT